MTKVKKVNEKKNFYKFVTKYNSQENNKKAEPDLPKRCATVKCLRIKKNQVVAVMKDIENRVL